MRTLVITATLFLLSTASVAAEKQIYKWVDEDGNVFYDDSVPPEYSDRPKEILNDQGVAVDNLEGKKTAEQIEAERIENERRAESERQRRADLALLATYLSVDEIEMHRDRRVELFQAQSRVTELYLRNLERRLESLRNEARKYRPYSDDPDAPMIEDSLADDLRDTKETIARHERNLQKYRLDERDIIERFDNDIQRFKRLKGID